MPPAPAQAATPAGPDGILPTGFHLIIEREALLPWKALIGSRSATLGAETCTSEKGGALSLAWRDEAMALDVSRKRAQLLEQAGQIKYWRGQIGPARAKLEHPFHVVERLLRYRKVDRAAQV